MFSTRVLLSAALISTALAGPWANLCAGKPSNEIRKCDSHGCGQYSAQSNQRPHQGVDVLCADGSTVYAPFTGMIMGQEKPYKNKNVINNGVRLSGRGDCENSARNFLVPFNECTYAFLLQVINDDTFWKENFLGVKEAALQGVFTRQIEDSLYPKHLMELDNQPSEVVKRQNIAGCGCCFENQAHLEIDGSPKVKQEQYLLPSMHICSVEMETLDPRTFFLERIGI